MCPELVNSLCAGSNQLTSEHSPAAAEVGEAEAQNTQPAKHQRAVAPNGNHDWPLEYRLLESQNKPSFNVGRLIVLNVPVIEPSNKLNEFPTLGVKPSIKTTSNVPFKVPPLGS